MEPSTSQGHLWSQILFSGDDPLKYKRQCATCGSTGPLNRCACWGAHHCSDGHKFRHLTEGHAAFCEVARRYLVKATSYEKEVKQLDLADPFHPPPPPPGVPTPGPMYTIPRLYHENLFEWARTLSQMNTGTAARNALDALRTIKLQKNEDPLKAWIYIPLLEHRVGNEITSWELTLIGAKTDMRRQRFGEQQHVSQKLSALWGYCDILESPAEILEFFWTPLENQELIWIVNLFILKWKVLDRLQSAQNTRLFLGKRQGGTNVLIPSEIVTMIQGKAAGSLVLTCQDVVGDIRNLKSLRPLIRLIQRHVMELSLYIDQNNNAFWPMFMRPQGYLATERNPKILLYPEWTDLGIAQSTLEKTFSLFVETPGLVDWVEENVIKTNITLAVARQRFLDND